MSIDTEPKTNPVVEEILGTYYKPEKILAQSVEKTGTNQYKVTYLFPTYQRTQESLGHVSMSQMHEAILEGLYCAIGEAIKEGTISTSIDFPTFLRKRSNAIYYRENFFFRRMLKENETADLTFTISKVEEKTLGRKFDSITTQISGFMQGEVECLLEK